MRTRHHSTMPDIPPDPGHVTLELLRRSEPQGRVQRRQFLQALAALVAAAPFESGAAAPGPAPWVLDDSSGRTFPPQHSTKVMEPVNVHEIQEAAARSVSLATYEYITGGAEDEYTLRDNLEAYRRTHLRQRVAIDVSTLDTSTEILGQRLNYPIMLDPTTKDVVVHEGDKLAAIGAHDAGAVYGVTAALSFIDELQRANRAPTWWVSQLGHESKREAQDFARQYTEAGATWLGVTVDHPYNPNRDRNIRNHFGGYKSGVLDPIVTSVTWKYIDWLRSASNLPIIVKGILNAEDAGRAVENGASAIIVSNHGGRALDGEVPSLLALPECVDAVGHKVPVMVDGGIRRGADVVKAIALGARAVLVGRPPAWGVAAFGAVGVQRVMELLAAELKVAMAIAGAPNIAAINRNMVRLPWEEPV